MLHYDMLYHKSIRWCMELVKLQCVVVLQGTAHRYSVTQPYPCWVSPINASSTCANIPALQNQQRPRQGQQHYNTCCVGQVTLEWGSPVHKPMQCVRNRVLEPSWGLRAHFEKCGQPCKFKTLATEERRWGADESMKSRCRMERVAGRM